jgi:Ca2+-binding RTX toxin-like protein
MRRGRVARFGAIGVACSAVLISAFAATNTVASSRAERDVSAITVDAKKPQPECNAFTVTNLVTGGASGGAANDLVLGTAGVDNPLRGQGGRDCLHGGGGNDLLRGDAGDDVCIGGPGTDTFHPSCEIQIQ